MKDKSIDQDERFFDAYVFTYDENPNPSVKQLSLILNLHIFRTSSQEYAYMIMQDKNSKRKNFSRAWKP